MSARRGGTASTRAHNAATRGMHRARATVPRRKASKPELSCPPAASSSPGDCDCVVPLRRDSQLLVRPVLQGPNNLRSVAPPPSDLSHPTPRRGGTERNASSSSPRARHPSTKRQMGRVIAGARPLKSDRSGRHMAANRTTLPAKAWRAHYRSVKWPGRARTSESRERNLAKVWSHTWWDYVHAPGTS